MRKVKNSKEIEKAKETKSVVYSEHFQGPLPHPDILYKYSQINSDIPNKIIAMAEEQSKARLENEKKEHDNIIELRNSYAKQEAKYNNNGQLYAFIVILVLILGGFILILFNKDIGGYVTIGVAIAGAIANIMYNNNEEK